MELYIDLSLQNSDCSVSECITHIVEIRALNSVYGVPGGIFSPGQLLAIFETETEGTPFNFDNLSATDVASCFRGNYPILIVERECLPEDVAICLQHISRCCDDDVECTNIYARPASSDSPSSSNTGSSSIIGSSSADPSSSVLPPSSSEPASSPIPSSSELPDSSSAQPSSSMIPGSSGETPSSSAELSSSLDESSSNLPDSSSNLADSSSDTSSNPEASSSRNPSSSKIPSSSKVPSSSGAPSSSVCDDPRNCFAVCGDAGAECGIVFDNCGEACGCNLITGGCGGNCCDCISNMCVDDNSECTDFPGGSCLNCVCRYSSSNLPSSDLPGSSSNVRSSSRIASSSRIPSSSELPDSSSRVASSSGEPSSSGDPSSSNIPESSSRMESSSAQPSSSGQPSSSQPDQWACEFGEGVWSCVRDAGGPYDTFGECDAVCGISSSMNCPGDRPPGANCDFDCECVSNDCNESINECN